jgi:hypothetical protein
MKFFAALALALPVVSALSLNPDPATLLPVDGAAPARRAPAPQTNAQRMAHGLNPLAPHALRHKAASKTARGMYLVAVIRILLAQHPAISTLPSPVHDPAYVVSQTLLCA